MNSVVYTVGYLILGWAFLQLSATQTETRKLWEKSVLVTLWPIWVGAGTIAVIVYLLNALYRKIME